MKKIFKNPVVTFILGALIFSSISVYAAHKYAASNITYKDTTLDQALNTLYTTQNTTVSSQTTQINSLQQQVTELTAAAAEKDYVTGSFKINAGTTNSPDLGFYPSKVILYATDTNVRNFIIISRNGSNGFDTAGGIGNTSEWYVITSNGFKTQGFSSNDFELKISYTYYAFR